MDDVNVQLITDNSVSTYMEMNFWSTDQMKENARWKDKWGKIFKCFWINGAGVLNYLESGEIFLWCQWTLRS
jgi:hypothetical protein